MSHTPSPDTVSRGIEKLRMRLGGAIRNLGSPGLKHIWEQEWRETIKQIEKDNAHRPEVIISLLGGTGAGKSTLVNALIEARLLPVSSVTACTAAVSEIAYCEEPCYTAKVEFISREQWREELSVLMSDIADSRQGTQDKEDTDRDVVSTISRSAQDKIRAVYRIPDGAFDERGIASLAEPAEVRDALNTGTRTLQNQDLKEFARELAKFLSAKESFWPIVKAVRITGPFSALRSGAKLVDLPGVNDPSSAREKVTHDYLKNSRFVWMVFNIKRAITRDIHEIMQSDDFLRQVVMDGRENSLTLIGTASDDVDVDTAWEEFGLGEDASETEVVLARNAAAKERVAGQLAELGRLFAQKVGESEHSSGLAKSLSGSKIFTVSALEYLKLNKLGRGKPKLIDRPEHTEVPDLRTHMQRMCEDYGVEAHSGSLHRRIDLLLDQIDQVLLQEKVSLDRQQQMTAARRKEVAESINSLRDFLDRGLSDHQERFGQQLVASRDVLAERIGRAIDRGRADLSRTCDSWVYIHWATLRAICRRGGSFHSPSSGYHDLPGQIAKPVLDGIAFAWSDFFGDKLGNAMQIWTEKLLLLAGKHRNDVLANLAVFDTEATESLQTDMERALAHSDKLLHELLAQNRASVDQMILEQQRTLYETIPDQIQANMRDAFLAAANESGTGMKRRIIDALRRHAQQVSATMFEDAQTALTQGVGSLTHWLAGRYGDMAESIRKHTAAPTANVLNTEQLPKEQIEALMRGVLAIQSEVRAIRTEPTEECEIAAAYEDLLAQAEPPR